MLRFPQKHPLLWAYVFVAYFSLSYHIPIYITGMSGSIGLRESLIMSFSWLIPILLLPQHARKWLALTGILMWPCALIAVFYFVVYGQEFSQSVIFIAFESNVAESSEFILSYWRWWYAPLALIFSAIPIWMWRQARPLQLGRRQRLSYALVFALIAFWPFINSALFKAQKTVDDALYHQMVRMEPAAPWNLVMGYVKYRQQMADMNQLLAQNSQIKPLQNLVADPAALPDTVVLVIGESTNRQRMSLYGYDRPTTPNLDALNRKGELVVFNDVVTPRPYTIEALQQVLSFADSKNPERFFSQPTLVNMMKQAGYDITWITNQQTQTRRNTMLTTFSQLADHQVYLNNNRQQNANQYDNVVLQPFSEALGTAAPRKFIVVHLLGTHRAYDCRYPKDFAAFTGKTDVPEWVSADLLDEYNSYDDAIRYNDMVVSELIEETRMAGGKSLLLYLSDHGEEVYDNPGDLFTGRNEAAPTSAMYTVPFIVWGSEDFQKSRDMAPWQAAVDRPYSSAYFIYSFADMVGLRFDEMDYSASLIAEEFKALPRWIGDPLNPGSLQDYASVERAENQLNIARRDDTEDATKAL
ncbi:phosphoethanolamine transferase CptA [Porticoccus sp.]